MKTNINKIIKQTTAYTLTTLLVFTVLFTSFEPVYLRAQTASSSITVTLNVDAGIAINEPSNVTMSPNISLTQHSSIGNQTWNVKTNAPSGYTLTLRASTTPAMQQSAAPNDFFEDYQTSNPNTWNVSSGTKAFGYSAYGNDVSTSVWGTGSSCGSAGTPSGTLNYLGFTTSDYVVATNSSTTTFAGTNTIVCFAAQQNNIFATAGTYTADIIATATVQ